MGYGINAKILANRIEALDKIGKDNSGGTTRLLYSPQWLEATRLLASWMREQGLAVRRDAFGNLFGRLEGTEGEVTVLTGSHIDTVIHGGAYDGAVGIISGLEALRVLNERFGRPGLSLEVAAICDEEGTRFGSSFLGSRVINGLIDEEEIMNMADSNGVSINKAMEEAGFGRFSENRLEESLRRNVCAYLELHVEQGCRLYEEGIGIGVVSAITGQMKLNVILTGIKNHAGTTPMNKRTDALTAAAEMILAVERLAAQHGNYATATVGSLDIVPNVSNVIPGSASFTVDIRHPDKQEGKKLEYLIRMECCKIAFARGVELRMKKPAEQDPAYMDSGIIGIIEAAADSLNLRYTSSISGAGHDAQIFSQKTKTGMIFIPSVDGLSHNPMEYTNISDIEKGTALLVEVLYKLAY